MWKIFNRQAAPKDELPGLLEQMAAWEKLSKEFDDPRADIPLVARDAVFTDPAMQARIQAETDKRKQAVAEARALWAGFDLDGFGAATQEQLKSLAAGKGRKMSKKSAALCKQADEITEKSFQMFTAESERRKQADAELREFVDETYKFWLKSCAPVEEKVTVHPPLTFKPRQP